MTIEKDQMSAKNLFVVGKIAEHIYRTLAKFCTFQNWLIWKQHQVKEGEKLSNNFHRVGGGRKAMFTIFVA